MFAARVFRRGSTQVIQNFNIFTTCTNPIIQLFYKKHNHCLQFLLGHEDVPREIKNNTYANFWGRRDFELYAGVNHVGNPQSDRESRDAARDRIHTGARD